MEISDELISHLESLAHMSLTPTSARIAAEILKR